jgi:hypothetical protein
VTPLGINSIAAIPITMSTAINDKFLMFFKIVPFENPNRISWIHCNIILLKEYNIEFNSLD